MARVGFGGTISGKVVDSESAVGLENVQIDSNYLDGIWRLVARTNYLGHFTINDLPSDDIDLRFYKPGYITDTDIAISVADDTMAPSYMVLVHEPVSSVPTSGAHHEN